MRSILMILGVILHSSLVYSTNSDWAVSNPVNSDIFYYLYIFIHVFRIPAFYVIAGFFSGFTISKYGYKDFLAKRTQRILIPLISTALSVNIVESYLRHIISANVTINFLDYITNHLLSTFISGEWDHHLWFLIFLFFYFFIAVLIVKILKKISLQKMLLKSIIAKILNVKVLILTLPLFNITLLVLGKYFPLLFYGKILGIFNLINFLDYIPFYIIGIVFYHRQDLLKSFNTFKIFNISLLAIGTFVYFYSDTISNPVFAGFLEKYSYYAITWVLCSFCFFIFHHFFNKPSKLFHYLSDASYSIYLFHQLTVITLGYLFIAIPLSIYIKFVLIILLTTAITLFIHHFFVLKFKPLRMLYNGK